MVYKAFSALALARLSCFISFHSSFHHFARVIQHCLFLSPPLGFLESVPLLLWFPLPDIFFFFYLTKKNLIPSSRYDSPCIFFPRRELLISLVLWSIPFLCFYPCMCTTILAFHTHMCVLFIHIDIYVTGTNVYVCLQFVSMTLAGCRVPSEKEISLVFDA